MMRLFTDTLCAKAIRYRWLIYTFVARDLKLRYSGSALGVLWTPVSQIGGIIQQVVDLHPGKRVASEEALTRLSRPEKEVRLARQ